MTAKELFYARRFREEGMTLPALGIAFGMTKQGMALALTYEPRPVPLQCAVDGMSHKQTLAVRRNRLGLCAQCGKESRMKDRTLGKHCRAKNRARYYMARYLSHPGSR